MSTEESPRQDISPCQTEPVGWLYKTGKRCKAKSKRTGKQCQRPAMDGKEVCMHHGGKSLTGKNQPMFKTGRYSKYVPKHLANDYEDARNDEKLMDLSENIALADVRLNDLLRKLNDSESLQGWNDLGMILGPLHTSLAEGKLDVATAQVDRLLLAWQSVAEDSDTWKEIFEVTEVRRKLVESEKKRLVDMDLMIAADRVFLLISFIQDIILRHVTDAGIRSAIAYELRAVIDKQVSGQAGSQADE